MKKRRIGAFLIARLSSKRLPAKSIKKILDKPMIQLMVERVKASSMIDEVVMTTSTDSTDDPLEKLATQLSIGCFRGSHEKVMDRINNAAEAYECDTIVELLGDNPLVHSDLIDDVIKFYLEGKYDYSATITNEYPVSDSGSKLFSIGIRVQVYSKSSAEQWINFKEYIKNKDKHPCAYIFEHPKIFRVGYFEATGKWTFLNRPDLAFAVNYHKNFQLIRAIFERNYLEDENFSLKKVYEQLDSEKDLYLLMGRE